MEIDQSLDLKRESLFDRIVLYGATGLFTLTIALTTLQVFIRWLNLPTFGFLHWTEPAARFVLIVATYLGAAVAVRNNEHISIRFLLERLRTWRPRVGETVSVLGELIVIWFLIVALQGTISATIGDWTTSIGGIGFVTSGHLYLGITVGLALMLVYAVLELASSVRAIVATVTGNGGRRLGEEMTDE